MVPIESQGTRRKRVPWAGAGALGRLVWIAALIMLLTAAGLAPAPHPINSGASTFRITGAVRAMPTDLTASPSCEGPDAVLVPGITRCLVFQVHNTLEDPIEVRSITMGLDSSFPPPPSGCSADKLTLPSYSGSLKVPAQGNAETPGLPIQLKNTPTNQDDCQEKMLHFTFAGTAIAADPDTNGPHQGLPETGAALAGTVLGAVLLLVVGWILHARIRRHRNKASS